MALELQEASDETQDDSSKAPFYSIPTGRIIAFEHPAIIENVTKALKSIGGEAQLMQIFDPSTKSTPNGSRGLPEGADQLRFTLRPDDPLSAKILSTNVPTQNILLKVTVPKRTGRKRKRGSDGPFIAPDNAETAPLGGLSGPALLQRLQDNPDQYSVQAVGMLNETHRIRTISDLQVRLSDIPMMQRIRDRTLQPDHETMMTFDVDIKAAGPSADEIIPPPIYLAPGLPMQYGYQQHLEPLRVAIPPLNMPLDINIPVPQLPPAHLPTTYTWTVNNALPLLRKLLDQRPIITIHVASREVPTVKKHLLEIALLYLTYRADSGPWRGAYIRYGIDPRTSAEHRFAQSIQIDPSTEVKTTKTKTKKSRGRIPWKLQRGENFVFDGKTVENLQQRIYQLCDLTAPMLRSIAQTKEIRDTYDNVSGWYWPGTVAKLEILTRKMIDRVQRELPVPTSEHEIIAGLPDRMFETKDIPSEIAAVHDQAYLRGMLDEITKALAASAQMRDMPPAESDRYDGPAQTNGDDEDNEEEEGEEEEEVGEDEDVDEEEEEDGVADDSEANGDGEDEDNSAELV